MANEEYGDQKALSDTPAETLSEESQNSLPTEPTGDDKSPISESEGTREEAPVDENKSGEPSSESPCSVLTEGQDERDLPPLNVVAAVEEAISPVLKKLSELREQFDAKLQFDAGKQLVIDRQHTELQELKKDLAWSLMKPVLLDIVGIIDDIEGQLPYFQNTEQPNPSEKILKFLTVLADDLRDILAGKGVEIYYAETGEPFISLRQTIVKTLPTSDPSLNKIVAEQAHPGYAGNNGQTILRPAQVRVYAYKVPQPPIDHPAPKTKESAT